MTRVPDFDELVGQDVGGEERERLRRVHELLVEAGPPPELSPEIESGPNLAMTMVRRRRRQRHRLALLAAAAVAVLVVFLGGYITGNRSGSGEPDAVATLRLQGTSLAPDALASLRVEPGDAAGNWPMTLNATGLPSLPKRGYYEVFLVRDGKPLLPCGSFLVSGPDRGVTVTLNAPYEFHRGDTWIVTEHLPSAPEPGRTVLEPVT